MKIEVTQCSMCTHYNTEQYCEVWEQYITNDAFYCACGVRADRKTEPQLTEKCPFDDSLPCEWVCTEFGKCKYKPQTEPQTDCSWK